MSVKTRFSVVSIKKAETHDWLLNKHYAKRLPAISYAFGLYHGEMLSGVVTFGMSPNYMEDAAWKPFSVLELNRLVINDGLGKNVGSYFVSHALKLLPQGTVVISYADFDMGHHGYIYQATNWIYTGVGGRGSSIYELADGSKRHQRHMGGGKKEKMIVSGEIVGVTRATGKARYYYFIGDKREKKEMMKMLRYPILPYPKGENRRYDASHKPHVQQTLFTNDKLI